FVAACGRNVPFLRTMGIACRTLRLSRTFRSALVGAGETVCAIACCITLVSAGGPAGPVAPPSPHWAYLPLHAPTVPTASIAGWARNPIDHFILAELVQHGMKPSPPADRRTLIRRVYFDLTGLPPTP